MTDNKIITHRRQWVIARTSIRRQLPARFVERSLTARLLLYYDPDLHVAELESSVGETVLILGLLVEKPYSFETVHYCAGRFVAIQGTRLAVDATGSLGVFYAPEDSAGIVASSSLALIGRVSGSSVAGRNLRKARKIDWDPAPMARVDGYRKLMVDQILDLETTATVTHPRAVGTPRAVRCSARKMADSLKRICSGIASLDREVLLALTGGADSRLIFSALLASGTPFRAVTFDYGDDATALDARLAQRLCAAHGITHSTLRPDPGRSAKTDIEAFREHSAGAGGDRAQRSVEKSIYQRIPENAIVLHGGALEIGRMFFSDKLGKNRFEDMHRLVGDLIEYGELNEADHKREISALNEWAEHRSRNPIANMSLLDLLYLEQRRGGWGAANRQAEDCLHFEWLLPANSWKVVEALTEVSPLARKRNKVCLTAMDLLVPGVRASVPINPRSYRYRAKKKSLSLLKRLSFIGVPRKTLETGPLKPKRISRGKLQRREKWNTLMFGPGAPRYAESLTVSTANLCAIRMKQKKRLGWDRESSGKVIFSWPSGALIPVQEHEKIAYCLRHWVDGLSWEEAGALDWYGFKGPKKLPRIRARLDHLDRIFDTVRKEGRLRSMQELNPHSYREEDGLRINIGPNGELVFLDGGTHRIAMALALGLPEVPAQIGVIHYRVAKTFRDLPGIHIQSR